MPILLRCRWCNQGFSFVGELPAVCPTCRCVAKWRLESEGPIQPYTLTHNDKLLLHALRIQPDEP